MIPYLKSNEAQLETGTVSTSDASWIGSLMFLGSLVGTLTVGIVADTIGMKKCLVVLTFPSLIFWIRTVVSTDVYNFYIARAVAGLSGGALLRIVPLFIEEITDINIREQLNAYTTLSISFGILFMFTIGTYISYFMVPLIIVPILILYFILMMLLPETPQYLLKKLNDMEALKSLKYYRNCNENNSENIEAIKNELEVMRKSLFNVPEAEVGMKDFFERSSIYGLTMTIIIGIIVSSSGYMIILTYSADIFKSSGSSLSANQSSIIVAFSHFVGTFIGCNFTEKYKRKTLMSISCAGSGLSLLVFATYSYADSVNGISEQYKLISIACLSCALFLHSIGISTVPSLIVSELVPRKIRDTTQMLFMAVIAVSTFANLKVLIIQSTNILKNSIFVPLRSSPSLLSPSTSQTVCSSTPGSVYSAHYSAFFFYQKRKAKINYKVIRHETGNSNARTEKKALFCMTEI
ncbi:unnamed protein product [Chironomus riparius]|uniref:Major facilitator superfamily (MFS) profile domain-containing protein n=1 Tax=Chironomus riparius TaxID=315576 RepID=A0A9P0JAU1_9DIPT|nr:unnamed protein product [Chironomus riparius]